MDREFLEGLGLEEETVEAILAEAERAAAEKEAQIGKERVQEEIDREIGKQGAKSVKAVRALLDEQAICGENFMEELLKQLRQLKAEHGYLFENGGAPRVVAPSAAVGKKGFGFKFTGVR